MLRRFNEHNFLNTCPNGASEEFITKKFDEDKMVVCLLKVFCPNG